MYMVMANPIHIATDWHLISPKYNVYLILKYL